MPTPQTPLPPSGSSSRDESNPTALTTQQLWREIEHSRVLSESQLTALRDLVIEKFDGVAQKFADQETAVNRAFDSAKASIVDQNKSNAEATTKSEVGFKDQIAGLGELISSENKAINDKIEALQKRFDLGEGRDKGVATSWGVLAGGAAFLISVIGVATAILVALSNRS